MGCVVAKPENIKTIEENGWIHTKNESNHPIHCNNNNKIKRSYHGGKNTKIPYLNLRSSKKIPFLDEVFFSNESFVILREREKLKRANKRVFDAELRGFEDSNPEIIIVECYVLDNTKDFEDLIEDDNNNVDDVLKKIAKIINYEYGFRNDYFITCFGYAPLLHRKYNGIGWSLAVLLEHFEFDLSTLIQKIQNGEKKVISLNEKLKIFMQICEGVHYLHKEKKKIFMDLCTQKVFLTKNLDVRLKYQKRLENVFEAHTRRSASNVFLSPEIVLGKKLSFKSDVFSFGILMFELLESTTFPYGKNSSYNLELKVSLNPDFRPVFKDFRMHPIKLVSIIEKCWFHDEKKRPSFKELLSFFKKFKTIDFSKYALKSFYDVIISFC